VLSLLEITWGQVGLSCIQNVAIRDAYHVATYTCGCTIVVVHKNCENTMRAKLANIGKSQSSICGCIRDGARQVVMATTSPKAAAATWYPARTSQSPPKYRFGNANLRIQHGSRLQIYLVCTL